MARSRSRKFSDLIGKDSIVDSSNDLVGDGNSVTTYSSIDALPLSGNDAGNLTVGRDGLAGQQY